MRYLLIARYSVLLGVLGLGLMGCNRGDGDPDDGDPIVVEESGPIALGDADPTSDEIDVIDEDDRPVIIRERTVVREVPVNRPAPASRRATQQRATPVSTPGAALSPTARKKRASRSC